MVSVYNDSLTVTGVITPFNVNQYIRVVVDYFPNAGKYNSNFRHSEGLECYVFDIYFNNVLQRCAEFVEQCLHMRDKLYSERILQTP